MASSITAKKRIYIAGKVTGENWQTTKQKFYVAWVHLEAHGYEAVNPITLINDENCDWKTAMRKCFAAMCTCDAIYCLPCWSQSSGARLERFIAPLIGIEIIEAEPINL
jgi:hypothetical protein